MEIEPRRWDTAEADPRVVQELEQALKLSTPLARVLVARGFGDIESAERLLNPRLSRLSDPFDLNGMNDAVSRIWRAIDHGERIAIFGDYDVDGISATALLVQVLRRLNAQVGHFLPHRLEHGYGLRLDSLKECVERHSPSLIVTVDCGTSSVEAVEWASAQGIDVVVTDHHEPASRLAPAVAVINPVRDGAPETSALTGVGVVFKLAHALVKRGQAEDRAAVQALDLRDYLDLVALGTIADVAPLLGENRILVKHGLARLTKAPSPGLKALLKAADLTSAVDVYHVGFVLGPRLNAAGRLGTPESALELLLTDHTDVAATLAKQLSAANEERRRIEGVIRDQATQEIDRWFNPKEHFGIVVGREGWHVGTIGIVASRLASRYYRPSVVIGFDEHGKGSGSCRSIAEMDVVQALESCRHLLDSFGGHRMAAGLVLDRANLNAFVESFNTACAGQLQAADLRPKETIDAWITLDQANDDLMEEIHRLKPLGTGHPAPVWGCRNVSIAGQPRVVGGHHLKLRLCAGATAIDAIAFNMGDRSLPTGPMDVLFELEENEFRGIRSRQLRLRDFRPSSIDHGKPIE